MQSVLSNSQPLAKFLFKVKQKCSKTSLVVDRLLLMEEFVCGSVLLLKQGLLFFFFCENVLEDPDDCPDF